MTTSEDEQAGIEAKLGFAASSHQDDGGEDEDDHMDAGEEIVPGTGNTLDLSHLVQPA